MWFLILISSAWAAPSGPPLPHPELGRLSVRSFGDLETIAVKDLECGSSSPCEASWTSATGGAALEWSPLPGLGVSGGVAYQDSKSTEADFRGSGLSYFVQLRGALPLSSRWWLAGQASYSRTELSGGAVATGSNEQASLALGTVGATAIWSEVMDGPSAWLGLQSSVLWSHEIYPLGEDGSLVLPLAPRLPVSAVGGLAIRSQPFGVPWEDSVRLSVGLEGRAGQANGIGTWVTLAW